MKYFMIANIKGAYLCLRCEKGKKMILPYLYLLLRNGKNKSLSSLPFLNHFSPTEGIPVASYMDIVEISNLIPARSECLFYKLRMRSIVSLGLLFTCLTFSHNWKHLVFWKHEKILGEGVIATVLWGSNLLIFPPLCFDFGGIWLPWISLLFSISDMVMGGHWFGIFEAFWVFFATQGF